MHSSTHTTQQRIAPAFDAARTAGRAVAALFDTIATWSERRRQRRVLESMPDYLLSDIGLSRADAEQEGDKPFWKG